MEQNEGDPANDANSNNTCRRDPNVIATPINQKSQKPPASISSAGQAASRTRHPSEPNVRPWTLKWLIVAVPGRPSNHSELNDSGDGDSALALGLVRTEAGRRPAGLALRGSARLVGWRCEHAACEWAACQV